MTLAARAPVRVDARLDAPLSRWLWLVKWVLVIPHLVVLTFLWAAFAVVTVVAFVAIVVAGRYPRTIFDFTLGVLRWSWRVSYYATGAFGTDRYPPFSLGAEPDYPATLDIAYPEHLSRGLVLVKWWLLAIPHYLVLGFLLGGGGYLATRNGGGLGRRPDRAARALRGRDPAVHRALPEGPVRPRARSGPVGAAGGGLRRADDRLLPTVPPRPRRSRSGRARGRRAFP